MAGSFTTVKMNPEDHQALLALLRFLAGKITAPEFLAVLSAQGRPIRADTPGEKVDEVVEMVAETLINAIR